MERSSSQAVSTQPPSAMPSKSQIPDLVRIGAIPTNTQMDVETSMLEPVQHSQSTCRFVFENKGILHSHSKLIFSLTDPSSTQNCYYPVNIGVHALVKSARLSSGGKTLIEIMDHNVLTSYESMFLANEHNVEKEMFSTGRMMNHNFKYDINASGAKAQGVYLDNKMDFDTDSNQYKMPTVLEIANEANLQIALSDLFPFLRSQQLPLFMMQEQLTLELTFEPSAGRQWQAGVEDIVFNIDTSETKLIADYIFYPQPMMDAFASANKDLTLTYMNYRLSKTSIDAGTSLKVRNVGGNGRICTKIIAGLQDDALTGVINMLGKYSSIFPEGSATSAGSVTVNVKYNNHLLYPLDVSNSAQHQHNTAQAQGMVPFVTRFEYSGEGGESAMSVDTLQGANLRSNLGNSFGWMAHRLNRNERINSRGIEYHTTYATNGGSRTQRVYLELVRMAVLSGGKFTVMDA